MVLVTRPRKAIATSWNLGATEFRPGVDPREGRKTEVVSELLWLANGITRIFRSNAQDLSQLGFCVLFAFDCVQTRLCSYSRRAHYYSP